MHNFSRRSVRMHTLCQTIILFVFRTNPTVVKLPLCLTDQAQRQEDVWGSGCIDPRILDLGTSWRRNGKLQASTALPPGKDLPLHIE
jgi:hypothetical protein